MTIIFTTYDTDGDPYDRLYQLAGLCEASGLIGMAQDIALGAVLGLSPEDQAKIGQARELYVFDCVLPNGWAITTSPCFDIHDESTYWTYADDAHFLAAFDGGGG